MATSLDLAKLLEQMPSTDPEIDAREKAARLAAQAQTDPAAQPAKPAPAAPPGPMTGKFTGPDPAVSDKLCGELVQGGADAWSELIGAIRDPAAEDFKEFKAEYLFHCLIAYVGRAEHADVRSKLSEVMAEQIQNDQLPVYARSFLIRELQWVGDKKSIAALDRALQHSDLFEEAARTLVAIGNDSAPILRRALKNAAPRKKLVLLHGLARLRDAESAQAFRDGLQDSDADVRLVSGWGLARLADRNAVESMMKAAKAEGVWERSQQTSSLLLMAENFVQAGQPQPALKIYSHLQETRTDPEEKYLRDLSAEAIRKLGGVS